MLKFPVLRLWELRMPARIKRSTLGPTALADFFRETEVERLRSTLTSPLCDQFHLRVQGVLDSNDMELWLCERSLCARNAGGS